MRKTVTGSHSGTGWWLVQRISAVILVCAMGVLFAGYWLAGPFDYAGWRTALDGTSITLLIWLLIASASLHAWVGLRDVLMDYVKPIGPRLFLDVLCVITLVMCVVWASVILWGVHG